jgi:cytosine/adenosine deaminase-related metal-dependent hydrolase
MRLAALIHKPRVGPKAMPAEKVLEMMTMGGARALGLEHEIGSLEAGKRADITILSRNVLNAWPSLATDPVSQVVYAHQSRDVDSVVIDGEVLLSEGQFVRWSQEDVLRDAQGERKKLLERVPELGLG